MSASSNDYAVSDSSYSPPPSPPGAFGSARATAPVGLLARGLARGAGAGGGHAGRVWRPRPTFVPLPDGAIAIPGGGGGEGEAGYSGKPCLAAPDYRARRPPRLPGRVPGYRCVNEALCAPGGCCGDKLWSPCMRGPSTGRPLDEFAIDLSLLSTF